MPKKVVDLNELLKGAKNIPEKDDEEDNVFDEIDADEKLMLLSKTIDSGLTCPETKDLALKLGHLLNKKAAIEDDISFTAYAIETLLHVNGYYDVANDDEDDKE
jgi:hypothetical protein